MKNGIFDYETQGVMAAEGNGKARLQVVKGISGFICENCGSDQVVAQHTYKAITTYERFIPCECGAARDGQAATQWVQVPYSASADGYLEEEERVDWEKPEYTRGDPVEGEIQIFCEACNNQAIQDRQEWESDSDQEEKIENSDEFTHRCRGCRSEVAVAEAR